MTSRENWPKFMGELNRIAPFIPNLGESGGSSIPIIKVKPPKTAGEKAVDNAISITNRQQARAAGLQNMGDVKTLTAKMQAIKAHQDNLVNEWFDRNIKRFLPAWYCDIAFTHLWMLRMLGLRMEWGDTVHKHEGQTYPATVVTIMWFRWQLAGERMVWDAKGE